MTVWAIRIYNRKSGITQWHKTAYKTIESAEADILKAGYTKANDITFEASAYILRLKELTVKE